jgi:fucose permease
VLFGISGIANTTYGARFPSIRDTLGISSAAVAWIMVVSAVGGLTTITAAGPAVARYGERICHRIGTYLQLAAFAIIVAGLQVHSFGLVMAGAAINGMAVSMVSIPQNTDAAGVERRAGHAMLPKFHGMYGFGCLAGAGSSAVVSSLGIDARWHLGIVAALTCATRLVAIRFSPISQSVAGLAKSQAAASSTLPPGAAPVRTGTMRAWLEKRTLAIAFLVMCFQAAESAGNNWLTLGVVDGIGASEAVAAAVFAAFQLAYALGRWFGAHIIDKFGRTKALAGSAVVALVGMGSFCLAPGVVVIAIGALLWGAGVALSYPAAIGAVSGDPLRAPGRVSVVSAIGGVAGWGTPPTIGWASSFLGLRPAISTLTVLLVVAFGLTRAAAHPQLPMRVYHQSAALYHRTIHR